MFETVRKLVEALEGDLATVEPGCYSGADAEQAVALFTRIERLGAYGRTVFSRRAAAAGVWKREGFRSPAEWVSRVTGSTLGAAIDTLRTAERLECLEDTRRAFGRGEISDTQAKAVARGASADRAAERRLLDTAQNETVNTLNREADRVEAAAAADEDLARREAAVHASRYARRRKAGDGAHLIEVRGTATDVATIWGAIEARREEIFHTARRQGRREPTQAYLFDALVAVAKGSTGTGDGPGAGARLRVNIESLARGRVEGDEVCEVAGTGPISVRAAKALLGDSIFEILVMKGKAVTTATGPTRSIPAPTRAAVTERDQTCVLPGCDVDKGLQFHHWQIPFAEGGPSEEWNLCRVCGFHHREITCGRLLLRGGPGAWESVVVDPHDRPPPPPPSGHDDGGGGGAGAGSSKRWSDWRCWWARCP